MMSTGPVSHSTGHPAHGAARKAFAFCSARSLATFRGRCFPSTVAQLDTATRRWPAKRRLQLYTGELDFFPRAACLIWNRTRAAARRTGVRIVRLKPAAQPELAGLKFDRAVVFGFEGLIVIAGQ